MLRGWLFSLSRERAGELLSSIGVDVHACWAKAPTQASVAWHRRATIPVRLGLPYRGCFDIPLGFFAAGQSHDYARRSAIRKDYRIPSIFLLRRVFVSPSGVGPCRVLGQLPIYGSA